MRCFAIRRLIPRRSQKAGLPPGTIVAMLEFLNVPVIGQVIEIVIIVVSAFFLLKVFNRLLTRVIGTKNEDRRRVINNVKRFLQLIVYSVAAVLILWSFEIDVTGLMASLGVGALVSDKRA